MKVTVVGAGYVGLVTATCLSEIGNDVICVEKDNNKLLKLNNGIVPIHEECLEEMLQKNIKRNRLKFTNSIKEGVKESEVIFIAVGTPSLEDGNVDMSQVDSVAVSIGNSISDYKVIVNKSTVPVGTVKRVRNIIASNLNKQIDFDVVSNPEFLREGSAVFDTFNGDRIVIGSTSKKATEKLMKLYNPFKIEYLVTEPESAEMIKYASNAFLATKISFINEISNICEKVGADVREVAKGMGMDKRIGNKFLRAGIGFGGACFPKDVKGLIKIGESVDYDFKIIKKALEVNDTQKIKSVKILKNIYGDIKNKTIAILGLAFKPNTDDLREAPSLFIINQLIKDGANIKVYDPIAMDNMKNIINSPIVYCESPYEAIRNCDALVLVTEWREFFKLDLDRVLEMMNRKVFIDGRNVFADNDMTQKGFEYYSIGIGSEQKNNFENKTKLAVNM